MILSAMGLNSQNNVFGIRLVAGLNFSELEGEDITDYFGANVGIISTMNLSQHFQLSTELLWSQNGEYINPKFYPNVEYGQIWLHHIEIPLHADWMIFIDKESEIHQAEISFGIAYAYLFHHSVYNSVKEDIKNQVIYSNKESILGQVGLTYFFTPELGLNLKSSLPLFMEGLDWTIAARMVYRFVDKA